MRELPIALLHPQKDWVLLLPQRLPVARPGVLPARQHQHGCGNLFFAQLKPVRVIKLFAQRRRAQVLANMRQPLLQPAQRALNIRGVGVRNVPPHGIRAGSNARHLTQRASADRMQIRIVSQFLNQRGRQCCRHHLRQMADPGAHHIVPVRLHPHYAHADAFQQVTVFPALT
jgi:hypothetical protein